MQRTHDFTLMMSERLGLHKLSLRVAAPLGLVAIALLMAVLIWPESSNEGLYAERSSSEGLIAAEALAGEFFVLGRGTFRQ